MDTILKKIEKVKADYNTIAGHFAQTRYAAWPEFEVVKKYLDKETILIDVGCGSGRFFEYCKDNVKKYYGFDLSENLLAIAKINYSDQEWQVGDMTKLPYTDNLADVIVSIAAFHHLPNHQTRLQALAEIKRVLKSDGIIFLTNWDIWQSPQKKYWWHKFWLKRSLNDFFIPWKEASNGKIQVSRYYHSFSQKELKKLFAQSGLQLVDQFVSERNNIVSLLKKC